MPLYSSRLEIFTPIGKDFAIIVVQKGLHLGSNTARGLHFIPHP